MAVVFQMDVDREEVDSVPFSRRHGIVLSSSGGIVPAGRVRYSAGIMVKNSINNPLRIDSVKVPGTNGLIGMTLCPGKKYRGMTGVHNRDLEADLDVIHKWGASMLVNLIEEFEYRMVHIDHIESAIAGRMKPVKLPIRDMGVPDAGWESLWRDNGPIVRAALRNGDRICVHCLGGLGRTGLFTARLLVEFGMSPDDAILAVRKARPGTIQTLAQETYVRSCVPGRI